MDSEAMERGLAQLRGSLNYTLTTTVGTVPWGGALQLGQPSYPTELQKQEALRQSVERRLVEEQEKWQREWNEKLSSTLALITRAVTTLFAEALLSLLSQIKEQQAGPNVEVLRLHEMVGQLLALDMNYDPLFAQSIHACRCILEREYAEEDIQDLVARLSHLLREQALVCDFASGSPSSTRTL